MLLRTCSEAGGESPFQESPHFSYRSEELLSDVWPLASDLRRTWKARQTSLYLLFLEFAVWSSSNCPRLHVQKVAARRPHGAAPWVPPLSTALPRSSPAWLCLWAWLRHFACFYPQSAAGSRATQPLALALCRANKSWHPVDHYWQPCMRWDVARSGPFISYLFHSHQGDSFTGRGGEGGVLPMACISSVLPMDGSSSVTCSGAESVFLSNRLLSSLGVLLTCDFHRNPDPDLQKTKIMHSFTELWFPFWFQPCHWINSHHSFTGWLCCHFYPEKPSCSQNLMDLIPNWTGPTNTESSALMLLWCRRHEWSFSCCCFFPAIAFITCADWKGVLIK